MLIGKNVEKVKHENVIYLPFHTKDGKVIFTKRSTKQGYYEFQHLKQGINISWLKRFTTDKNVLPKIYLLMLGLLFDYIMYRVIFFKNKVDLKFGTIVFNEDDDRIVKIVNYKSHNGIYDCEKQDLKRLRFRTRYSQGKKVIKDAEVERNVLQAKERNDLINAFVKVNPRPKAVLAYIKSLKR